MGKLSSPLPRAASAMGAAAPMPPPPMPPPPMPPPPLSGSSGSSPPPLRLATTFFTATTASVAAATVVTVSIGRHLVATTFVSSGLSSPSQTSCAGKQHPLAVKDSSLHFRSRQASLHSSSDSPHHRQPPWLDGSNAQFLSLRKRSRGGKPRLAFRTASLPVFSVYSLCPILRQP